MEKCSGKNITGGIQIKYVFDIQILFQTIHDPQRVETHEVREAEY
jgi:hypothetical protein